MKVWSIGSSYYIRTVFECSDQEIKRKEISNEQIVLSTMYLVPTYQQNQTSPSRDFTCFLDSSNGVRSAHLIGLDPAPRHTRENQLPPPPTQGLSWAEGTMVRRFSPDHIDCKTVKKRTSRRMLSIVLGIST
jgi:hypothetical protein